MGKAITVKMNGSLDRWIKGFATVDAGLQIEVLHAWKTATDLFFDRTQEYAHVLTGEMKQSGSAEVEANPRQVVGRVQYDSPHALYEEARGGSHALITRGWEAAAGTYQRALPDSWEALRASWR
jgi:hypothetical protein